MRALIFLAALCCVGGMADRSSNSYSDNMDNQQLTPFKKGKTFVFQYNAQIASGLIAQDQSSLTDPQQKALTRIQAQAKITFGSDRHAQLNLEQIRVGQLNEKISNPTEVKPMNIFEQKQIPEEKKRQLQLPCDFSYVDGVIERVQFEEQDEAWSKNIKRAVLNMIQLNLKRNNAQGLRSGDEQESQEEEQQQNENSIQGQLQKLIKSFTIPEITLEGACQATYTISPAKDQQKNITKSINYKQCSKVADVAYGFQTEQQQAICAQCQQKKQQQQGQKQWEQQTNEQQQMNPCDQFCDQKEVKQSQLDRSTTLRYVIVGTPEKYALKRTELLSQYVLKNMKAESGPYGSAMHTIVSASLQLQSVKQQERQVETMSSDKDESLMYSNEWEVDVKRFYMFGDDEFPQSKSSPFQQVPKEKEAVQALRKLVQASQDKQQGFEVQTASQLQRLVESLRMCSVEQLKRVEEEGVQAVNGQEKQKAEHIFTDALAIAGTRNCVQLLAQKIQNGQISQTKAVQALKNLNQLPAPSDQIVHIIQRLCKTEKVQRQQPVLKQACWLTFGALVNEVCQHKTQQKAQQTVFGAQSGFDKQEVCPQDKKKEYKQTMLEQFEQAQSTYDKVVAISTLGNAGIDTTVQDLEKIIKDKRQERIVRVKAIDALRRLRTQMPRKIQQILLPIFQNNREQPEIRTAAFGVLVTYTQPEQQVIDQLVYAIAKEGNKQVQSFCYYTMKMLARSKNPAHQQMAKHVQSALKLANVDEQQLRYSGKVQIPLFSDEQQEGVFISLASVISSRSALPVYAHAQLDSMLNDQFQINSFKLSMLQQEAEQWYQNVMGQFGKTNTRGQRRSSDSDNGSSLRSIYSSLGIKSRRSSAIDSYGSQQSPASQQPFAMLMYRTNDVDHGFMALDQQNMPEAIRAALNGEQSSMAQILAQIQKDQQVRGIFATSLSEKQASIPTSAGVPLRIMQSIPVVASIDGTLKMNAESTGLKAQINAQPMVNLAHIQKMECWTPFLTTGVESIRSAELNLPIQADLIASRNQGLTVRVKLPRNQHNVFGLHSVPYTYTAEVTQSGLVREPRHVRVIQNNKLERMQHETNTIVGVKSLGIPLRIHAHYHWPAHPLSYQQFMQMLLATENTVHIQYQPSQDSPREAVFQVNCEGFQKSSGHMPELQSFYTSEFEQADSSSEDNNNSEDMQLDNHSSRRQKLENFLGKYKPSQQYKHALKLSAKTVGGAKECQAEAEVQAHCDSRMQFCKIQVDAERSPMGEESQKWTAQAQAQLLMPETIGHAQDMQELSQKNDKLQCQAQAKWGTQQKQQISIRVQGQQAKRSEWSQMEQQQKRYFAKRAAFLNMFNLEAEYSLNRNTQNTFSRALELAKSYYFWNTDSKLVQGSQGNQQQGKVLVTLIIDPITQQHANVSVKTPAQLVRLQQIELPVQTRPFPLVRSQNAQSTHSLGQLFSRVSQKSRAECSVDGYRVNTFDDQEFNSPLSTDCYSVLAKDCANEQQPQFAVLMKEQQNGQKKLKVITPEQTIECQQKQGSSRIQCKENGQTVQKDEDSEAIDFNNEQGSDVTVHVSGVSVRFNGRKAWIKLSQMYKSSQCGLCGHYDDNQEDEWRMGNGQNTQDLVQFHRSYTGPKGGMADEEQCSEQQLDQFYGQKGQLIRSQYAHQRDSAEQQQQGQQWEDDEQFDGDFDSSSDLDNEQDPFQSKRRHGGPKTEEPQQKTKVVEMNQDVCFSVQPVKQCPRGTVPTGRPTSDYESEEDQDQQNQDQQGKPKKVQFVCLSRNSSEARRLLRQVRQGQKVVDVSERGVSFTESVREAQNCRRI